MKLLFDHQHDIAIRGGIMQSHAVLCNARQFLLPGSSFFVLRSFSVFFVLHPPDML